MLDNAGFEGLATLGRVLGQQLPEFGFRKVAQAQRRGLDVERAAALDVRAFAAGINSIVAYVADSAQDDALGKMARTPVILGAQLS